MLEIFQTSFIRTHPNKCFRKKLLGKLEFAITIFGLIKTDLSNGTNRFTFLK